MNHLFTESRSIQKFQRLQSSVRLWTVKRKTSWFRNEVQYRMKTENRLGRTHFLLSLVSLVCNATGPSQWDLLLANSAWFRVLRLGIEYETEWVVLHFLLSEIERYRMRKRENHRGRLRGERFSESLRKEGKVEGLKPFIVLL